MYAIVRVGGKQYRVEQGDSLVVDRLREEEGAKLILEPLLLRSDGETVFEGDGLEKVKVEAVVKGHESGKKVRVVKFKPKRGYKRTAGHRSKLTRLEVEEIKLLSRRPAAGKAAGGGAKESAAESRSKSGGARGSKSGGTKGRAGKTTAGSGRAAAGKGATGKGATGKTAGATQQEAGNGS